MNRRIAALERAVARSLAEVERTFAAAKDDGHSIISDAIAVLKQGPEERG